VVENCVAYNNGYLNTANACGPAGIWSSNSTNIVIRKNKSFLNKTAGATDGGGFGLDGGVTNSILEDNFSYGNDGPGFLLAQYYGAKPFFNNSIINNISINDARKNDSGAIHIWGPESEELRNLTIKENKIHIKPSKNGRPRAIMDKGITNNLKIKNNKLINLPNGISIEIDPLQNGFHFDDNSFESLSGKVLWDGEFFEEIPRWLKSLPQRLSKKT